MTPVLQVRTVEASEWNLAFKLLGVLYLSSLNVCVRF